MNGGVFPHTYWSAQGAHSAEGPCIECGEVIDHLNHHDAAPLFETMRQVGDNDGEALCKVCARSLDFTPRDGWGHRPPVLIPVQTDPTLDGHPWDM